MKWRAAIRQLGWLLLASLMAGGMTHFLHPRAPDWYLSQEPLRDDEVDLTRIEAEFGGEVLWLDSRPTEQYEEAHIPGARLLNEQGFDEQLFELLEILQTNELPVVIYCGGEACEASRKVKQRLLETFALEGVWVLKGGWKSWQAAGRPAQTADASR